MSAQAAQRLGLTVLVLDGDLDCPAGQVTPKQIIQDWDSVLGTQALASQVSVVTLENEWVTPENLRLAMDAGADVIPGPSTMAIVGDKFKQRLAFSASGLPVPRFTSLSNWDDLIKQSTEWGGKLVLKSRCGGYDGYGVKIVEAPIGDVQLPSAQASDWYAEEFIPFDRELAVMVSRNKDGKTSVYPVVESRQTVDGHRCDVVIAPAPGLSVEQEELAQRISLGAVDAIGGIGLFGVELFLNGDRIIINEIAPRPHNSGHYTMDGCRTSQFEQHIRSVRNLPPGATTLLTPVVVMVNLLAPFDGLIDLESATRRAYECCPNIHLHWYGKTKMREGRKMGHINLLGQDLDETLSHALAARLAFWGE